jgi:hypothetical protein
MSGISIPKPKNMTIFPKDPEIIKRDQIKVGEIIAILQGERTFILLMI